MNINPNKIYLQRLAAVVSKGGMTILQSFAATHGSYKKAQKGKPYSLSFSRLIKQMNFSATFIFCILYRQK